MHWVEKNLKKLNKPHFIIKTKTEEKKSIQHKAYSIQHTAYILSTYLFWAGDAMDGHTLMNSFN